MTILSQKEIALDSSQEDEITKMDKITEFKISQLDNSLQRLSTAIDKICNRVDSLEKESFVKSIHKRFLSFLFLFYPVVLVVLVGINDIDTKKISSIYEHTQAMMDEFDKVVASEL